MKDNELLNGKD